MCNIIHDFSFPCGLNTYISWAMSSYNSGLKTHSVLSVRNGRKIRVWLLNNSKVIHDSGALEQKTTSHMYTQVINHA